MTFSWKYSVMASLLFTSFLACKSIEPIEETTNDNNEVREALSPNDLVQSISFSDIRLDQNVFTGQLSNGLTYYIMPNKKPENRAELRLVVKVGSINEDYDQLGIAHFIEHMAFNGTENFDKNELVDYLESVGTQFGPDLNAYTSFDETVYMLQVRTDVDEQFNKGLLVLSDWASGLTLDEEEIDKERGVVISEWRNRLSASQRMQNEYLPVLLKGSRYANRLPIGDPEIIKNADYESIKRFYYEWYRPELMAVVAVGDFTPALVEEYISQYFGDLPKSVAPRPRKEYGIGHHDGTLVKVCTDPEAPLTQVRIINKMEPSRLEDVGDFRERMVSKLFTQMMNARLSEKTQEMDAPFLYASCYSGPDIGPMDSYSSFAACKDQEALTALKALVTENLRVQQHGFTAAELERAKAVVLKSAENVLIEKDKIESGKLARRYIQHFLKGTAYFSPEDYHMLVNSYVPKISLDMVNQRSQWFKDSNRVVIITGPEKEGLRPTGNREVLDLFEEAKKWKVQPYEEVVNDGPLLDIKLGDPEVQKETLAPEIGERRVELDNGASVIFKNTDFNNDEILFKAVSKGGHSVMSDENYVSASHAAWIIRESGIGDFSNIELEKKLAGKKVAIRPFIGSKEHGLTGNCGAREVSELGQLIYLFFTDLRKDSVSFLSFKERMTTYYSRLLSDPSYYFSNEVSKIATDGNARMMFPSSEDMQNLDMGEVYEVFEKIMSSPSDYHFIFTGNLTEEVQSTLLSYISAIPTAEKWSSSEYVADFIPESSRNEWSKGQAPKSYVEVRYYYQVDSLTRELKDDLGYLKSILDIRLREVLREDEGGVYSIRSFLSTNLLPDNTILLGYGFTSDPEMSEDLILAAEKVFNQIGTEGAKEDDVQKVREIERRKFEKKSMTNEFWLRAYSQSIVEDMNIERYTSKGLETRLARLNAQRMKELMSNLLNRSSVVTFLQKPE